jgi:hypothetical protein
MLLCQEEVRSVQSVPFVAFIRAELCALLRFNGADSAAIFRGSLYRRALGDTRREGGLFRCKLQGEQTDRHTHTGTLKGESQDGFQLHQ